jgi:hypothetical protein
MDPVTGESVVTFIVPCGIPSEILDVAISNKAGFGLEEGIFVYAYVSCPGGGVPRDCVPCFID